MDCTTVKNARLNKTFTIKKVKAAFHYMGSFKLAGPDGIKPIVMKHFGPKALGCITKLFQTIYSTGVNPGWFLYQSHKNWIMVRWDHLDPSLLPNLFLKTIEQVVEWSLREHANDYSKISYMQHAYSGTKGTDTALSTLVNMIKSSILRKELCLVISVDIKGAFDNLPTYAIQNALEANNYPPIMIRWYMNFLKNRISIAEVLGVKLSIRPHELGLLMMEPFASEAYALFSMFGLLA